MGKVPVQKVTGTERLRLRRQTASLLHTISSQQAVPHLLTSLFTPSELVMLGRRIDIALELLRGVSGEDIRRRYHVSYSAMGFVDAVLRNDLPDYRSTIPALLKRPPHVVKRGIARLRKRAPFIGALLEVLLVRNAGNAEGRTR